MYITAEEASNSFLVCINCHYEIPSRRSVLVTRLDLRILPYIIFLIAPVLGRMTDSDEPTRLLATSTFASLIKLVPLEVRCRVSAFSSDLVTCYIGWIANS